MAIAADQRRTGSSTTTSVSAASWATPTDNDIGVAQVWANDGGFAAISGWTRVAAADGFVAAHGASSFYKLLASSDTAVTATNASASVMEIFAVELSGAVNTGTYYDQANNFASGTGGTSAQITGNGALAQAAEYVLTSNGWAGSTSAHSYNSGLTLRKGAARQSAGDLITAATTALNPTCSWTTSRTRTATFITIKESITVATVTHSAVTAITRTTATANGNVTGIGDSLVTERGVVWNTSPTPTTANNKVASGSGSGAFTAGMTGLPAGTLIYTRCYAINSAGTSYASGDITFTTRIIAGGGGARQAVNRASSY